MTEEESGWAAIRVPGKLFWSALAFLIVGCCTATWYVATKDHDASALALTVARVQEGVDKDRAAQQAWNQATAGKIDGITLHVERIDSQVGFVVTFFQDGRGPHAVEHAP